MVYLFLLMVVWVVLQVLWPANPSASWWSSCGQWRLSVLRLLLLVSSSWLVLSMLEMQVSEVYQAYVRSVYKRCFSKTHNAWDNEKNSPFDNTKKENKIKQHNCHNSVHYPSSCLLFKTQLNSICLSVTHRKHITSPLWAQQVNAIYRFVTMVY
jgi:hypothetical protein